MKKHGIFISILLIVSVLLLGCKKNENIDGVMEVNESIEIKENKLSEEEKQEYIRQSGIEAYIPEGADKHYIELAYLTGSELPEIICTYFILGQNTYDDLIIMQYSESLKEWGVVKNIDDFAAEISPIGVLQTKDNKEIALYNIHYHGAGQFVEVAFLKYDEEADDFLFEDIETKVTATDYPILDKEAKSLTFEGDSHREVFTWDGESFKSIITNKNNEVEADVEIHYSIINNELKFAREYYGTMINVKKGDIIGFIQDNVGNGRVEKYSINHGLEQYKEMNNYFIVTKDDLDIELSLRINYEWYDFYFRPIREYSSDLNGKDLIYEDYMINVEDQYLLDIDASMEDFIDFYGQVDVEKIDVITDDENVHMYNYEKNGVKVLYYDNLIEKDYRAWTAHVFVDGPRHSTFRGLKVGDSKERLIELYGEGESLALENGNILFQFMPDANEEGIHFDLFIDVDPKTNKVVSFSTSSYI